jgi:hypothetical protein
MWICREDFGIERNQSPEKKDGNAQFSLCCTSTQMPDFDFKIDIRHFPFSRVALEESRGHSRQMLQGFMRGFVIRSISPEEVQALKCLRAVEGYLDLGLFEEADEELRALDPAWFALPHTLSLQLRVFAGLSEHE